MKKTTTAEFLAYNEALLEDLENATTVAEVWAVRASIGFGKETEAPDIDEDSDLETYKADTAKSLNNDIRELRAQLEKEEATSSLDAFFEAAEQVIADEGWEIFDTSRANTRSTYYKIRRPLQCEHDEANPDYEELKIRVSDHGDCYCNNDYSVALSPSGDDGSIEGLRAFLRR